MKIAFLHFWTLRLHRGVETMVLSLANELAEQGADVSILTARQTHEPLVKPSTKVKLKQFPTFRYFEATTIVPFYVADLVRNRYDVVVAFFADFGEGWALSLSSLLVKPRLFLYLTFPHEAAPHRYRAYRRWDWANKAAGIMADADYTAQAGERFFGGRKIVTLPSGTDPHRFSPNLQERARIREKYGFNENDVVLLNVAALERRKGVHRIVEVMPVLAAQNPHIRYLVLGEGPERPNLENRVRELSLEQRVTFAGTTTNLPAYYNAADIYVMLSDAEAGSIACLEAMSSCLPVIVSNGGGFNEIVSNNTGRIVDPNSAGEIIQAVLELANDSNLRSELGLAGRQIIMQKFSWQSIAKQMSRLFEETVQVNK